MLAQIALTVYFCYGGYVVGQGVGRKNLNEKSLRATVLIGLCILLWPLIAFTPKITHKLFSAIFKNWK